MGTLQRNGRVFSQIGEKCVANARTFGVRVLPSVSCRSSTLRIWDSGINIMCLSWAGGLVCPTGLLNVLITL